MASSAEVAADVALVVWPERLETEGVETFRKALVPS